MKPHRSLLTRRAAAFGACIVVVVTACNDGNGDITASPPEATPTADSQEPPVSTSAGTIEPPTPTTTLHTDPAPDSAPQGAGCLVGEWTISGTELSTYYDAVAEIAGFQMMDVTGEIRLSFTESTYQYTQDFALSFQVGGDNESVLTSGADTGSWVADGEMLTSSNVRQSRLASVSEDGTPVDDPGDLLVGVFPQDPIDQMPYSCDGPTVGLPLGEFKTDHLTVQLTPAP